MKKIQIDMDLAREMRAAGHSVRAIADHFGCAQSTVSTRFESPLTKERRKKLNTKNLSGVPLKQGRKLGETKPGTRCHMPGCPNEIGVGNWIFCHSCAAKNRRRGVDPFGFSQTAEI